MKPLQRMRYYTMNSWNRSESLAYNLKVYNVIDRELQDTVYDLLDCEQFYNGINYMIMLFDEYHDYEWQAGFNGRSGGYLVLYKGGKREDGTVYSYPGRNIELEEVPVSVRKSFRKLAIDIVKYTENMAKEFKVTEKVIEVPKKVKVLERVN